MRALSVSHITFSFLRGQETYRTKFRLVERFGNPDERGADWAAPGGDIEGRAPKDPRRTPLSNALVPTRKGAQIVTHPPAPPF